MWLLMSILAWFTYCGSTRVRSSRRFVTGYIITSYNVQHCGCIFEYNQRYVLTVFPFLSTDCFWLLDLLLDFTSNKILSPILKDLDNGPPKLSESVPERMDGESYRTLKVYT